MTDQRAEILLVEDNPNDVKLTMNAFKTANLANSVHVARDGVEALEFLFGAASSPDEKLPERPKLILLDLKLPRLDGHEVLKRIKGDPRTSAIPVVILTSSMAPMGSQTGGWDASARVARMEMIIRLPPMAIHLRVSSRRSSGPKASMPIW